MPGELLGFRQVHTRLAQITDEDGPVVLRRWLVTGFWGERELAWRRDGGVGIGFLNSVGRRGSLSSRPDDRSVILADGLVCVSSVAGDSCGGIPGLRLHSIGLAACMVWLDAHSSSLSAPPGMEEVLRS